MFGDFIYPSGEKNKSHLDLESYSISNAEGFIKQDVQFKQGGLVAQADKSKSVIVGPKSFAYNPARLDVGSIGYQNLNKRVLISPMYEIFKINNKVVDDIFLWHYLKSDKFNKIVRSKQEGGVRTCFNLSKLCETKMFIPESLEEQQKISNFLDKVDEYCMLINHETIALKKYKEVLQKTFYRATPTTHAHLKDAVQFQSKSKVGAGQGISNGKYPLYLSGEKATTTDSYMLDGCYIIANDGGEANFKLTSGKFSYSDHCICLKAASDDLTSYIFNYLESQKKKITYIGFVGSGLKNIDRDYFANMDIPLMREAEVRLSSQLFSVIDALIRQYDKQINALNRLKNVLLKEMFV